MYTNSVIGYMKNYARTMKGLHCVGFLLIINVLVVPLWAARDNHEQRHRNRQERLRNQQQQLMQQQEEKHSEFVKGKSELFFHSIFLITTRIYKTRQCLGLGMIEIY